VNGYYKAELIRGPARNGPWKTIEEVELATLGWVHWHNTQRLHGYLGDIPPVEFEALHTARRDPRPSDSEDPKVAGAAPRTADRLPEPQPERRDSQTASNPPREAVTGPTTPAPAQPTRPPWPLTPPGTVTIMCGNPGSGIQRAPRRPRSAG
jgi:hypothetical protein